MLHQRNSLVHSRYASQDTRYRVHARKRERETPQSWREGKRLNPLRTSTKIFRFIKNIKFTIAPHNARLQPFYNGFLKFSSQLFSNLQVTSCFIEPYKCPNCIEPDPPLLCYLLSKPMDTFAHSAAWLQKRTLILRARVTYCYMSNMFLK